MPENEKDFVFDEETDVTLGLLVLGGVVGFVAGVMTFFACKGVKHTLLG